MDKEQRKDLISRTIHFLESEAEFYGDFTVDFKQPETDSTDDSRQNDSTKEASTRNLDAGPDQENESSTSTDLFETKTETPKPTTSKNDEKSDAQKDDPIGACTTLEELKALCKDNEDLKTDLKNTNLVFGVGDPNADLMIIGEAPGFNEDKQGEPFVGKAGQLLNDILHAIGFKREDVYIANILKHRPPNNRNPSTEERQRSLPYLKRQIELVNPKLILCLGKVSANTLLDNSSSLSSMRGKFHPFMDGIELMVTYHPAALLRNKQWKYPTWDDVQKLRKRYDEYKAE